MGDRKEFQFDNFSFEVFTFLVLLSITVAGFLLVIWSENTNSSIQRRNLKLLKLVEKTKKIEIEKQLEIAKMRSISRRK